MTTPPGPWPAWQPGSGSGSDRSRLRAGSADRDRVTEILTAAYRDGRLTDDEYMDRAADARTAVTYADLDLLIADLPAPDAMDLRTPPTVAVPPPPGIPARRPDSKDAWRSWATVVGVCTLIWLITVVVARSPMYFWPIWVAGPWALVLVLHSRRD